MATKLSLYNGALRALGERPLSSLTENRPPRLVLDQIWDGDGGADGGIRDIVLSAGFWNFALRTVEIEYDPDISPSFGYSKAFLKPSDWIRTVAVASDGYFSVPYNLYSDEQDYWFSDLSTMYVKLISKGDDYGYNLSKWTMNFTRYTEHLMAFEATSQIAKHRDKKTEMFNLAENWLEKAQSVDAMNQPTESAPLGSWVTSRRRGGINNISRVNGGWLQS